MNRKRGRRVVLLLLTTAMVFGFIGSVNAQPTNEVQEGTDLKQEDIFFQYEFDWEDEDWPEDGWIFSTVYVLPDGSVVEEDRLNMLMRGTYLYKVTAGYNRVGNTGYYSGETQRKTGVSGTLYLTATLQNASSNYATVATKSGNTTSSAIYLSGSASLSSSSKYRTAATGRLQSESSTATTASK